MSSMVLEVFPKDFSPVEQCQVLAILAEADSAVRAYEGDFTAPWLLSPIHARAWLISKGANTDVWEEILRKSNLIVDEYMSKR
jgi:hypothetical protein